MITFKDAEVRPSVWAHCTLSVRQFSNRPTVSGNTPALTRLHIINQMSWKDQLKGPHNVVCCQ